MAVALTRGAVGLSVVLLIGCATGYDEGEAPEHRPSSPMLGGGNASAGMSAMNAGSRSGPSSGRGAAAGSGYQGTPCMRGETEPCSCEGDMEEGVRICLRDADSPTENVPSVGESGSRRQMRMPSPMSPSQVHGSVSPRIHGVP